MPELIRVLQVEYASAGQLSDRCTSPMAERQARALFRQLLDGLAYCHSKGVYHRDLRTELILLSGRQATTVRVPWTLASMSLGFLAVQPCE